MDALLLTAGLLVRTLFLIVPHPERTDGLKLTVGLFIGFYLAGRSEELLLLPLGFAGFIAFAYKDRILREISEGTLLLYGLLALFVHTKVATGATTATMTDDPIGIALFSYVLLMLGLCLSQIRVGYGAQVCLVSIFLASNIYIAYASTISFMLADTSAVALVLIGFYGLHFVSNILYLINLIPIPLSKRQSFSERWQEVRAHTVDLERSYIDIDIHAWRTLSVLAVGVSVFAYDLVFSDWVTGLALAFTVGHWLTAPPHASTFTPRAVLEKR